MPELALGTAQFGLNYGITNVGGKVSPEIASTLLTKANEAGFVFIDTAQAYGNVETVMGEAWPSSHSFRVVSKLPAQPVNKPFDEACELSWHLSLELTLERLQIAQLDGFLLHAPGDLVRPDGYRLLNWLRNVQKSGLVGRIGVSIYEAIDLENLPLDDLQLVQIPCSLYDQRLIADGTVDRLRNRGIAIHARSLYLQGLLVTPPENWSQSVAPAMRNHHEKLCTWAKCNGWSLVELALAWARRQEWMEAAVVGLTTSEEFDELCLAWYGTDPWEGQHPADWAWSVGRDLDPRQWS